MRENIFDTIIVTLSIMLRQRKKKTRKKLAAKPTEQQRQLHDYSYPLESLTSSQQHHTTREEEQEDETPTTSNDYAAADVDEERQAQDTGMARITGRSMMHHHQKTKIRTRLVEFLRPLFVEPSVG